MADTLVVYTLSSSASVLSTLQSLIHRILAPRTHLSAFGNRDHLPRTLRIVIAEGRPAYEGATLATALLAAVRSAQSRRTDGSQTKSEKHSIRGRGIEAQIEAMRQWAARKSHTPTSIVTEGQVSIEIVTDAAVVSSFVSTTAKEDKKRQRTVVLLGARSIDKDGCAIQKVGSRALCWMAHRMGVEVLVLARTDKVGGPEAKEVDHPVTEVIEGWRTVGGDVFEMLVHAVADKEVKVGNAYFEVGAYALATLASRSQ